MTDYDKLAQRLVALGFGRYAADGVHIWLPDGMYCLSAEDFCNDWRVAGALIERLVHSGRYVDFYNCWNHYGQLEKPLPAAIAEACCDALEVTDE